MKQYIFEETGELRVPRATEYYFSNNNNVKYAEFDYYDDSYNVYPILKLKEVIELKWQPKEGEMFWYIGMDFQAHETEYKIYTQNNLLDAGNCFQTKELCEEFIKERGLRG